MDLLKKILDILTDLPKLVGQSVVVYRIVKDVIGVIESVSDTFDLPQLENVVDPLNVVLSLLEKLFDIFGIDPMAEPVPEGDPQVQPTLSEQSVENRLATLVQQYHKLEEEE